MDLDYGILGGPSPGLLVPAHPPPPRTPRGLGTVGGRPWDATATPLDPPPFTGVGGSGLPAAGLQSSPSSTGSRLMAAGWQQVLQLLGHALQKGEWQWAPDNMAPEQPFLGKLHAD